MLIGNNFHFTKRGGLGPRL